MEGILLQWIPNNQIRKENLHHSFLVSWEEVAEEHQPLREAMCCFHVVEPHFPWAWSGRKGFRFGWLEWFNSLPTDRYLHVASKHTHPPVWSFHLQDISSLSILVVFFYVLLFLSTAVYHLWLKLCHNSPDLIFTVTTPLCFPSKCWIWSNPLTHAK